MRLTVTAAITTSIATSFVLLTSSPLHASTGGGKSKPALATGNVQAVLEADGHGLRGKPWAEQQALQPLSAIHGFDAIPAPVLALELQDNEYFLAEDEITRQTEDRKPLRFAIPVPVAIDMAHGEWIPVEGGHVWRVILSSANATTARLHITGLNVPQGQEVRLSSPGWEDSVIGPIEGVGEFGTGEAWSMSMPTNEAMIEWFVPAGTKVTSLPFTGVDYYHGYRQIWKIDEGEGGVAVGTCHLDPICFPNWANESNGTVRLIFTGSLCSGQLTATTAADETPYVATANHCISTASVANSCQFNFFYRRNTCSAAATAAAGTNVTGSDLSATQLASDCTLLMIRPTLPTGIYWVGWLGTSVGTNTASTGLHHPDGSYQRISFGTKNANSFNCGSPTSNWSSLSWNAATQYGVTTTGVTEGGSSGSAIYRDSDKKMYGVLTCGASFCSTPQADDGYGRWDLAVTTGGFGTLLAAGADDNLEQNDTCATAVAITPGTAYAGRVVKRLDEDWYSIPVAPGASMSVNLTFTHANGDVDVQVFGTCGGSVLADRNANTNNEVFSVTNSTASSSLLMRVYLGADTRNDYSMTVTVTSPPPANDECATATAIADGSFPLNTVSANDSAVTIPASCLDGAGANCFNDVWFRYTAPCTGTATLSTCGSANFDTRIVMYASSTCPTAATPVFACNDDTFTCSPTTTTTLLADVTAGTVYYIRVGSKVNSGGTGTLTVGCEPSAPPCPSDLDGSGTVDAADLATVLGAWGSCAGCASDIDGNGTVDAADLATVLGSWGACP
jgi:hypothetical protein